MSTRQKRESRLSGFIVPVLCIAILGYFAHHAQTGRYSIHTKEEMKLEAQRLQFQLTDLQSKHKKLKRSVKQLTNGTLEHDALDQIIRSQLGYVSPNELIVLYQ